MWTCDQGAGTAGQLACQRHVLRGQARSLGTDELTWSWPVGGSGRPWGKEGIDEALDAYRDVGALSRSYPSPETNLLLLSRLGNRCYEDLNNHGETTKGHRDESLFPIPNCISDESHGSSAIGRYISYSFHKIDRS